MHALILGDGERERAWAAWFAARPEHHLEALYPDSWRTGFPDVRITADLDEALAAPGIDLVVVGGPIPERAEALRRAAAVGFAAICLHPPGDDSEPYYQVALSRQETGAVVIPDLPLRLHPGVVRMREAIRSGELGTFRGIRHECRAGVETELPRRVFPGVVDVVRSLLGEIEALTASGDPPGEHPDLELVVQLRAAEGRRAEVRIESGVAGPSRLTLNGSSGSLTLEYEPAFREPGSLVRRGLSPGREENIPLGAWDPREAVMRTLSAALEPSGETASAVLGPTLNDGTRAMELSEAVVRSLRRSRTIDLHYEAISEEASFKSVMASTGCTILLGILVLLPLSLAGPALGMNWTIYLAWIIPPVLVVFAVLQFLRFGIRREGPSEPGRRGPSEERSRTDLA